jgi:hypothetical protein
MTKPARFIFAKWNYSLFLFSVCILILGFMLMTGEENNDMSGFNEGIYSFRRITLAPLVILSGYAGIIFAIMSAPGKKNKTKNG